jgi:hypothetical protein
MKKEKIKQIKRVIRKTTPKLPPNKIIPNKKEDIKNKEDELLWEDEWYAYESEKGDE